MKKNIPRKKGKTELIASLDKLTLVAFPTRTKTIKISVVDKDGEDEPMKLLPNVNQLIAETFLEMGYHPRSKTNEYIGSQYSLLDGLTAIARRGLPVFTRLGTAFLEPHAMEENDKLMKILTQKTGYPPHASEVHLCFTGKITKSFHDYATRLKRDLDPKKLLVQTFERDGEMETLMLRSGVASMVCYNKEKELKKKPKKQKETGSARSLYVQKFEAKYGSSENQTRIEFRFRSSTILEKFSELLQQRNIQGAVEELLEQVLKRFELPKPLIKKLKQSIARGV
jgi:hypothetical protein